MAAAGVSAAGVETIAVIVLTAAGVVAAVRASVIPAIAIAVANVTEFKDESVCGVGALGPLVDPASWAGALGSIVGLSAGAAGVSEVGIDGFDVVLDGSGGVEAGESADVTAGGSPGAGGDGSTTVSGVDATSAGGDSGWADCPSALFADATSEAGVDADVSGLDARAAVSAA